ncbi:MAG: hypothetical protein IT381_21200 [Deltaproteobacteria bacterium]|nr:hypothetical protein [Deltaproteobacteria bacterium]
MIREWHVVYLAGVTTGIFLRWLVSKLARVIRGPWLVVAFAALGLQGCAGLVFGIGLRTAGAIASTAHAVNQGKKAIAAAERGEKKIETDQERARRVALQEQEEARKKGLLK